MAGIARGPGPPDHNHVSTSSPITSPNESTAAGEDCGELAWKVLVRTTKTGVEDKPSA